MFYKSFNQGMYSRYHRSTEFCNHRRPSSMYGSDQSEIQEEPLNAETARNLSQRTAMTVRSSKSDATHQQQPWTGESVRNVPQSATKILRCSKSDDAQKQEPWSGSASTVILQRSTRDETQKREPCRVKSVRSLSASTSAETLRYSITNVKDKLEEIDRLCREDLERLERSLRDKKSKVEGRQDGLKEMLTLLDKSVRHVEETRRKAEEKFRRYVEDFLKIRARVLMLQDQWDQQHARLLSSRLRFQEDDDDYATVYPDRVVRSKSPDDDDSTIYPELVARCKCNYHDSAYPSKFQDEATSYSDIMEPGSSNAGLRNSVTSFLQLRDARASTPSSDSGETVRPMDKASLYKLEAVTDLTSDRIVY